MRRDRAITVDDFYGALEEGARREAERKKIAPPNREDRGPFTEEKYYDVVSRKTGEACFASRIRPSEPETGTEAMYQVIRRGDLLPRWMTASDFVTQFKRLEGIPEPVRIPWIESNYKKIAVEEDNVSGALLASWQNRVLRKNERTMKESA